MSEENADYPDRTLYEMICALQSYLKRHKADWKSVQHDEFKDFNRVFK